MPGGVERSQLHCVYFSHTQFHGPGNIIVNVALPLDLSSMLIICTEHQIVQRQLLSQYTADEGIQIAFGAALPNQHTHTHP